MNEITIETTRDLASLDIEVEPTKRMPFVVIRDIILVHYNLEWEEVRKRGRLAENVLARAMIFYFMREFTTATYVRLGKYFEGISGDLDHTTVMHGIKKIKDRIDCDKRFKKKVEMIRNKIKENEMFSEIK